MFVWSQHICEVHFLILILEIDLDFVVSLKFFAQILFSFLSAVFDNTTFLFITCTQQ